MMPPSHHRKYRPAMWGAIGLTVAVVAAVAAFGVEPSMSGYVLGALLGVCLAMCALAFWMDSRATRATTRLIDRLRRPTPVTSLPPGDSPREQE